VLRIRKHVCILLALALLCAPALSGCAGAETEPAAAEAHHGIVSGIVEQLKQEDDETELKEMAEHELGKQEREEAHEQAEQQEIEVAQAEEPQAEESEAS